MKAAQIRLNLSDGILQMVVAVHVKLLPASYLVEGVEELAVVGVGVGVLLQRGGGGALSHTHTHRHTHTQTTFSMQIRRTFTRRTFASISTYP